MPIEFLDILADDGWVARPVDPAAPDALWSEGGSLADAPVDVAATFAGRSVSTAMDPTFALDGIRLAPGFAIPRHRHDQQVLRIVFGGTLEVRSDDEVAQLRAGQFCVIDAGTVHSVVAGPDGATYTESWHLEAPPVQTTWHPDPAWVTP
ncbi:MAG: cupin domain-containing protein [Acidimicrobiales bacterium]|nr:cupin domain-containing protein [Acidimicrobiales bacterium]